MEEIRLLEGKYKSVMRWHERGELQKLKTQLSNLYRTIEGQCQEEQQEAKCTSCNGTGMLNQATQVAQVMIQKTPVGGCIQKFEVSSCHRCRGSGIEKQTVIVRKG